MRNVLKGMVFYPLLWLRGLLIRVGRFLAGLFMFGVLLSFFVGDIPTKISIAWGLLSFALFMLCQFYDWVLVKLNPTDSILVLD